jgi:hypothetical protein
MTILSLFGSPLAPRPAVALLQLSILALLLLHNKLPVER